MPNIQSVLKAEIARIARKETRAEVSGLKKASSQHRSTIAALRRDVQSLRAQLRKAAVGRAAPAAVQEPRSAKRFQARGLTGHRKRLGLSAQAYGKLVGVTGQTILNWEAGDSRPRAAQLQTLAAMRAVSRRQALERLEQLAQPAAPRAKPTRQKKRA